MNYYRPPRFGLFPPAVKNLLIANVLFFIATLVLQNTFQFDLTNTLGLHYFLSHDFKPYQGITYMFMHGGFMHIFFNMFALWMFGNMLENYWGSKRFLLFYFICGIGAALTQEVTQYIYFHGIENALNIYNAAPNMNDFSLLVQKYFTGFQYPQPASTGESVEILQKLYQLRMDMSVTIGASGAIFGVLLAFGMLFPDTMLYVFFAIPIKAKYFVIIYGLIELYSAMAANTSDNVAHFAHLGGMVFGFFLIQYWKHKRTL
ncbi:MAG: rhomboid family intramembrane serine protease [Bacteroidia bacterium]|jgi:membrane associated rhomboid family serine protease|nr:rhomboid family intramembrane serine protease [Bacteroidia bacterium]